MKQFVPITDDVLYRHEQLPGPLVPYRFGLECLRDMREPHYDSRAMTRPADADAVSASPSSCLPA